MTKLFEPNEVTHNSCENVEADAAARPARARRVVPMRDIVRVEKKFKNARLVWKLAGDETPT